MERSRSFCLSGMTTPQKVSYHSTHVHFTFGNYKGAVKSSYQTDFSCAKSFPTVRCEKKSPPPSAEVIPQLNKAEETAKWISSTRQDFAGFGEDSRRRAYEVSHAALQNTKALHNRDLKLLHEDVRVPPMVSRYRTDFCNSSTFIMPRRSTQWDQHITSFGKNSGQFISEAKHAFQWPSANRLKLPQHFSSVSFHY